jgi:predicted nucleotidyltransferase component of viral defense system
MLHKETVAAETLALIQQLMKMPELQSFRLVGGTALSLQIGHRISTDIDLFTLDRETNFENIKTLLESFFELEVKAVNRVGLFCYINGIKIDLVKQHGVWLDEALEVESIRLSSLKEIAAMKIGAITGRGRKRDFFDLYMLLNQFSLKEILEFYHAKFSNSDEYTPIKSLIYFEDAEDDNLLKNTVNFDWEKVKEKIRLEVKKITIN